MYHCYTPLLKKLNWARKNVSGKIISLFKTHQDWEKKNNFWSIRAAEFVRAAHDFRIGLFLMKILAAGKFTYTGTSNWLPTLAPFESKSMCFWQPLLPVFLTESTAKKTHTFPPIIITKLFTTSNIFKCLKQQELQVLHQRHFQGAPPTAGGKIWTRLCCFSYH